MFLKWAKRIQLDTGICTLTNAFVIIRDSITNNYTILEAPLITHDLKNNIITAKTGTLKRFDHNDKAIGEGKASNIIVRGFRN